MRSTLHVSVVASLVLAGLCLTGFYFLNAPTGAARLIARMPSDPSEASAFLLDTSANMNSAEMAALAREVGTSLDAKTLSIITQAMIYTKGYKGPLAVLIAEDGAVRFGDPALLNRAGLEYLTGRFIGRDYRKAALYLSNPNLARSMISQFYLAEVLLAKDNPDRDPERGRKLLKMAADAGIEAARKRLAQ